MITKITEITNENFKTEVSESSKPVLIDFWAEWCGPCRVLSPVVDEFAEEHPEYKICKINVDEEPELAQEYGVTGIPTLISFKEGKVHAKAVGVQSKETISEMLE